MTARVAGAPVPATLLRLTSVSKSFAGVRVLDDVSLEVRAGEVVALVGHNGSGKSTLVKVLAGLHRADPGALIEILGTDGQAVGAEDVASRLHFIHQDLGLVEMLTTTENLGLGRPRRLRGLLPAHRRAEHAAAQELIDQFGASFDVRRPVGELSPAERTVVAMARALSAWSEPDHLLVLDEPTTAFHIEEVDRLFAAVRAIVARGAGVVFISHRLSEVFELADRVVVLRDGRLAGTLARADLDHEGLVELIAGHRVPSPAARKLTATSAAQEVALEIANLRSDRLHGVDLTLRHGEVLGVAGVAGSGREQLAGAIFGAHERSAHSVRVAGVELAADDVTASIDAGLGYVPGERHRDGAVMTFSARENLTLPHLAPLRRADRRIDEGAERADFFTWAATVGLRPPDPDQRLVDFSGGNQQKIVIAKWLRTTPRVLLLDEPTQGVDVGAKSTIYDLLEQAADAGTAVLVASSDNEELVRLCDRVIVLDGGCVVAELDRAELTEGRLLTEVQRTASTTPARMSEPIDAGVTHA